MFTNDDPLNATDPWGLCGRDGIIGYYPGGCATTAKASMAAGKYVESHVPTGGFSVSAGLRSVAHVAGNASTEVISHWRGITKVVIVATGIVGGITCTVATLGVCSTLAGSIAVTLIGGASEGVAEHALDGGNQTFEGYFASAGEGSLQEASFAIPEEFLFGGEAQHAVPAGFFRTAWNLFH